MDGVGDEVVDVVEDDEEALIARPGVISRTVPLVLLHVTSVSFPHHQYEGVDDPLPSVQGYKFAQLTDSRERENQHTVDFDLSIAPHDLTYYHRSM